MFIRTSLGIISLILLLSSCASNAPADSVDLDNGARRASIVMLYTPESLHEELPQCLSYLPLDELATRHFVKVKYKSFRHVRVSVAELPDTLQVAPGDQVELWPEDCSIGKISRITRILSSIQ